MINLVGNSLVKLHHYIVTTGDTGEGALSSDLV